MDEMKPMSDILSAIRESLNEAESAYNNYYSAFGPRNASYRDEQEEIVVHFLERAFLQLRLVLEAQQLPQLLALVVADHEEAKQDLMKSMMRPWGEPDSFWVVRLVQYVRAIDGTFGTATPSTVTRDLVDILRASVYSVTDAECFAKPPSREADVHVRVEAVLRCVFPNLRHKPPIGKPIKNFEPDTGLPSVRTLIEYKFVATKDDVKRVAEEVLADTRGYVSTEWDTFIYVIYETKRLKPEAQWKELLKTSGVTDTTQIIVMSGEEPIKAAASHRATNKARAPKTRRLPI